MQIERAVINALKAIDMPPSITPILSDRNGVEPSSPYLLINIISVIDKNIPRRTVSHEKGNKVERVLQTRDYLISFTFHASANDDTVQDWIHRFQTGISSDFYDYAFAQQGLGLVATRGVMYQPSPVQGKNYKRAIIDIVLRAEVVEAFIVNDIKKVTIKGHLIDSLAGHFDDVVSTVDYDKPESGQEKYKYMAGDLTKLVGDSINLAGRTFDYVKLESEQP